MPHLTCGGEGCRPNADMLNTLDESRYGPSETKPAKFLASLLAEKGKPLTTPA